MRRIADETRYTSLMGKFRRLGIYAKVFTRNNAELASGFAHGLSDAAGGIGEVEPDFDAAEVRAFSANGRGDAGAKMARRPNITRKLRMDFAKLCDFVHRGLKDFFLGVEAGAHGPFVEQMEQRAGFVQANGFGVGENVKSDFERHAAIEKLIFSQPRIMHGAVVCFFGAWIRSEKHGRDVVGLARV